jgi:hypothetical protein
MKNAPCIFEGCADAAWSRGWCKRHYDRWRRHGDPSICLKPMADRGAPTAWLRNHASHQGDECLIWPFAKFPDGRAHMRRGKPARIMCEMAHGTPPSPAHEAAHSCGKGNDACVNPRHLYWATKAQNDADKVRHGTIPRGERLPQAKLTEADVRAIRSLAGTMDQREIAAKYGVHFTAVWKIINRQSWRHVQ